MKKRQVLLNLHKNVLGQLPFLSNNDQNNTIDQYPESQKRQTISGEPKVPDNTQRAKSARQYPESQKRQTIPGEPITLFFFQNCFENKKTGKYYSVYIKMFLNNYHFYQIMTRIIPIEPSIPGEPKAPDNTWRANYFLFFLKIAF